MYNWIASRWWSARADVLGTINHPIGPINEDTTIKAITIGPGKLDSDVVTFNYKIADDSNNDQAPDGSSHVIRLTIGTMEASVNGNPYFGCGTLYKCRGKPHTGTSTFYQ